VSRRRGTKRSHDYHKAGRTCKMVQSATRSGVSSKVRLVREIRHASVWGTYHFASAGNTSWHAFAQASVDEQERFTQRRPRVTPMLTSEYPTPAKRPPNSVLDTSRFEQTFGITPRQWRDELHAVVRKLLAPRSNKA